MSKKEYPAGNPEFLEMIRSGKFDAQRANEIMAGTDYNQPVAESSTSTTTTTYLYEAMSENNLSAVAYLLDNGADPNYCNPDLICDCALWDLQYLDVGQDWQTRYEIAKLFFEHGANPNLKCDGETFYDYVLFKVYNDDPNDDNDWENLLHLYKLLILYGGGGEESQHYCGRPELTEDINLSKVDEYDVRLHICEDGYHIAGRLVDGEENEVGIL